MVRELEATITEIRAQPESDGRLDRPRVSAHLRAFDEHYAAAVVAYDALVARLQERAPKCRLAHAKSVGRADQIETVVLGLLFGVLGVATFLLWRMAQRMRSEAAARQHAISELRDSEAKYRSIFDHANEGIFQTTPDGRFITANRTLARMYGYRSPAHLMKSLTDLGTQLYVDPSQREALLATLREEGMVSNFEFEVQRADGRTIWLRENVRAVRDEQGELRYLEGTVEDVTDRWWSEQRRRLQFATARVLADAKSVA
jgi:PAS domain S-box-containing protein